MLWGCQLCNQCLQMRLHGTWVPGWDCYHCLQLVLAYEYSIIKKSSPLYLLIIHDLLSSVASWYLFIPLCTSAELGYFPYVEQYLTLQVGPLIEKWQFVSLLRHHSSWGKSDRIGPIVFKGPETTGILRVIEIKYILKCCGGLGHKWTDHSC